MNRTTLGGVEILDLGEFRALRYFGRRVTLGFVGGPADGVYRAYKTPAPQATSAEHGQYVLSIQGGKCFYAHVSSVGAFLDDDEEFYTHPDLVTVLHRV